MLYLIILLLLPLKGESENIIKWTDGQQIDWSVFKGKPDPSSPYDAQLNSGVRYSYSYESKNGNVKVNFDVFCYMDPNLSWSKKGKQTDYLLGHEQLHFDISELHARKLRKALQEYDFSKNPQKEVEKIFNRITKDRQDMQNKYDKETDHSKNRPEQAEWADFVAQQLAELNAYK